MSDIAREDALDSAMSGQSHTERLIDSVCAELNAMAVDLKICHTVNGEWPAGEKDTLYKYDHLRRMAVELRKLKSAHTQAPASGEVEPVCLVRKNDSGQVYLCNPDGTAFQSYNYIGVDFYTHPPAKVPEINWKASEADYDHSIHTNPDAKAWADFFMATFPSCGADPETMHGWFANAMMAMYDHLKNTNPTTAATPEAEWVRCSERLPTEADADDEEAVWWWVEGPAGCRTCNQVEHASWDHVRDMCLYDETLKDGSHWKPTGLKRPQPPVEQEGKPHHRSSE